MESRLIMLLLVVSSSKASRRSVLKETGQKQQMSVERIEKKLVSEKEHELGARCLISRSPRPLILLYIPPSEVVVL